MLPDVFIISRLSYPSVKFLQAVEGSLGKERKVWDGGMEISFPSSRCVEVLGCCGIANYGSTNTSTRRYLI